MAAIIEIVDWAHRYENNRTRELKKLDWVPMSNRHDGDGYTELMDHPNGAAHFGAWCAMVEVASRCAARGLLSRDTGAPHDALTLARMTRIPVEVWNDALPRFEAIGWIKWRECSENPAGGCDAGCDVGGGANRSEGKGKKERREGREAPHPAATFPPPPPPDHAPSAAAPLAGAPPRVADVLPSLKTVNPQVNVPAPDEPALAALLATHGAEAVIDAYRMHQRQRPGRALHWFLVDFAKYDAAARKERPPDPLPPPPTPASLEARLAEREAEEAAHPELVAEAERKAAELREKMRRTLDPEAAADDDWDAAAAGGQG